MTVSRTTHAVNNTIYGIIASAVTVALNLVLRVIIVDYLGDQINGLHSLFVSTISILSLVQTGFSTAMIIHLYKPILDQDKLMICKLLSFYKILYKRIAFIFLALGVFVDFFVIDLIVTTTINMTMVRIYFFLFILSYFVNYRTYYKRSILFAEQKNRISVLATMTSEVLCRGIALLLIILFKQYYLFLLMLILDYFIGNLICSKYVDKHHPYLKEYKNVSLPKEYKERIFKTVKPLMVNQISDTVQRASTSILISILLGNVAIVGYYGSYQLIGSTIQLLMSQFGGAFTSGFGSLAAENDESHMANVFNKGLFVVGAISTVLCVLAFSCIQDIILLLFGKTFVLPLAAVSIIIGTLFITIISVPVISIQNAMGLHRLDSVGMVIQAFTAVILSYLCGKLYGMNGILLGSVIPTIFFTVIRKGYVITHAVFPNLRINYIRNISLIVLKFIAISLIILYLCSLLNVSNIFYSILIKAAVGLLGSILLISLLNCRNKYLGFYISILCRKINIPR